MPKIIIIGGPTASGKSKFALNIAKQKDSVIINADSMQVYAELPIITAQPSPEEQDSTPHLLYGFLPANQACNVALWIEHATQAIEEAFAQDKTPILVGGTGMYLRCLIQGMSDIPAISKDVRQLARDLLADIGNDAFFAKLCAVDPASKHLHVGDTQRITRAWEVYQQTGKTLSHWQQTNHKTYYPSEYFETHIINPPREELYANCDQRFEWMLEHGAIEEIKAFSTLNLALTLPACKALGVPELLAYTRGEISLEGATTRAQQVTRNFAKRQVTWFRNSFSTS